MTRAASRIVVLNYNGRSILEKCLPSVVLAAKASRKGCRVTVLDNCSQDDSREWVLKNCPDAEWVDAPQNKILCSYNDFAKTTDEEFLIFLNNDIRVAADFVDPLIETLENDPKTFFAALRSNQWDTGKYEGSLSKMEFRRGLLWGSSRFAGYESRMDVPGLTMQCGFGAFRRRYFLQLGGYDDIYLPGTVEDSDLCFRGYRQGWIGRYVPQSRADHLGQATFKKAFGSERLRRMNRRNLYLFVWKNIRDPFYLTAHLLWLPVHLVKYALCREWDFLAGFFDACRLLPEALKKRQIARAEKSIVSDREIFKLSKTV